MVKRAASKKPAAAAASPASKIDKKEKKQKSPPASGGEQAGGFIFMCSAKTKAECYRYRVFGMPKGRMDVVGRIKVGTKLFLYDFDVKYLYGVYSAACDGGMDLVPEAFGGRFRAQVKFEIDGDFLPIPETSLKSAIKENYDSKGKFTPELSSKQVRNLRTLFRPLTLMPEPAPQQYVHDRRPAPPPAAYLHPPPAYLPPLAAHLAPPAAYVPPPTAYLPPPAAHLAPPAAYVPASAGRSSHLVYAPLHSVAHYVPEPLPSRDRYAQYQHPPPPTESQHVSAPVLHSNDPYYAAHLHDPYRLDALRSQYRENPIISESATYGAAPEAAATTNLQLIRDYRSFTTGETEVTIHASELNCPEQTVTYVTPATGANAVDLPPNRSYPVAPAASAAQVHHDVPVSTIYSYATTTAASQVENVPASSLYFVGAPATSYQ